MTTTPRIALVTCSALPDLDDDDKPLIAALAQRGIEAVPAVWDDPAVDWAAFDLAVIRSVWDYTERLEEFQEWAGSVPRLVNPANVVRWNTDKHYLQLLAEHGLPVIETTWLEPNRAWEKRDLHNRFPAREEFVIKPAVSAGSRETARYTAIDANSRRYAIEHALRLLQEGRSVMVQRYIKEIDTIGETALVFFHGTFSHAVKKDPMLAGGESSSDTYRSEKMTRYRASETEIEAAQNVLAFARARIPGRNINSRPLPYARVDLVTPADGKPLLMELELVEPSLFLGIEPGALNRFADSLAAELRMDKDTQNISLA